MIKGKTTKKSPVKKTTTPAPQSEEFEGENLLNTPYINSISKLIFPRTSHNHSLFKYESFFNFRF
jgi:hypothetical protein